MAPQRQERTILVTSALPYANGSLHMGHLLEAIQTDIWVRYQKLRGHNCIYVCADDAHGSAVMLKAREKNIPPEEWAQQMAAEHLRDYRDCSIHFDYYHTTHSQENRHYCEMFYQQCFSAGHIRQRPVDQLYDPQLKMFLSDRMVVGQCPHCGAESQYGDHCEACGKTYAATDLLSPTSSLSGGILEVRQSEHYFFKVANFTSMLRQWVKKQPQLPVANKLTEWLDDGLSEWDISRDAPYFGFQIPNTDDKYFYVWLDAPLGYLASFHCLCREKKIDFAKYWCRESSAELYHFIGKDIINFHGLFWPAMLAAAGYRQPTAIYAHGFLTINGEKMSKSRGNFLTARNYLDLLDAEYLRYYLAARLTAGVEDISFSQSDFVHRVNADLVGKIVNIASRCAKLLDKHCANRLSDTFHATDLYHYFITTGESIADCYDKREYALAMRTITQLADRTNQYLETRTPWAVARHNAQDPAIQEICSVGLNLFRLLILYLRPVLPNMASRSDQFMPGIMQWSPEQLQPLTGVKIAPFQPLLQRVDMDVVARLD